MPNLLKTLWTAALMLLMVGCASDPDLPQGGDGAEGTVYLRLAVSAEESGAATRSNPTGGEYGDGQEDGRWHENDINDLMIFIYGDPGQGLDSPAETPILASRYVSGKELTYSATTANGTIGIDGYKWSQNDRMIVAVNMGDLSIYGLNTLGKVRTHITSRAWTPGADVEHCTGFAMANAHNYTQAGQTDSRILKKHDGPGTPENPNLDCSVAVERLAARVDLMIENSQADRQGGVVTYDIVSDAGTSRLTLYDIRFINAMQTPGWMLKHVTADDSDLCGLLVCGTEKTGTNRLPINYVVEPRTLAKEQGADPDLLDEWYGETAIEVRRQNASLMRAVTGRQADDNLLQEGLPGYFKLPVMDNGHDYAIALGYTNENTQSKEAQSSDYCTGLLLEGVYEPAVIYADAEMTTTADVMSYWRVVPIDREYTENDCRYFSNQDAAEKYAATLRTAHVDVKYYHAGICHYIVWLRHANDDYVSTDTYNRPFPMEYGTVRNNIYRLSLTFSGPGSPDIDVREPGEVKARIFVRRWNVRWQDKIYM